MVFLVKLRGNRMKSRTTIVFLMTSALLLLNGCEISHEDYNVKQEVTEEEANDLPDSGAISETERNTYTNDENNNADSLINNTDKTDIAFDELQELFLSLSLDTKSTDLESLIAKYNLPYTKQEYNYGENITYVIAFTEGSAKQSYADSGDRIKASFSIKKEELMTAEYISSFHSCSALLYNYGTWYDFREKTSGRYTGYYVIDPLSNNSGLVIKYDNGNEIETNYFPCDSAKDALQEVIFS